MNRKPCYWILIFTLLFHSAACLSKTAKKDTGIKNKTDTFSELVQVRVISREKLLQIDDKMTYSEVIQLLGPTLDVGSATMTYRYQVEEAGILEIRFFNGQDKIGKSGRQLLEEILSKNQEN